MSVAVDLYSFNNFKKICGNSVKIALASYILDYIKNSVVVNFTNRVANCSRFIAHFKILSLPPSRKWDNVPVPTCSQCIIYFIFLIYLYFIYTCFASVCISLKTEFLHSHFQNHVKSARRIPVQKFCNLYLRVFWKIG